MGDTFNFNGSIGQFIKEGNCYIEHYHAQSVASSTTFEHKDETPRQEAETSQQEPETSNNQEASLPSELATDKAQGVLQTLQQIGLLDENYQPAHGLSWAERGYLAQQIAFRLDIEHQWVTFGKLWHCDGSSLRSGYNRAKDMPKMAAFDEKIKVIF